MVVLCAVGIVLGRVQTAARNDGRLDPVSRTVAAVVRPVTGVAGAGVDGVSDFFGGIFSAKRLVERNRFLESQLRGAELYDERVRSLRLDVEAMRRAAGYPGIEPRKRIPADVTMYFPYENRIVINIGRKQGLWPGLPVVTAEGLLGVVQVVDERSSHVSLLSSPTQRIGAITDREPAPAGLLHGEASDVLVFELLDSKHPVETNDIVMTSGFSENIPRGIPIGRVVRVEDDPEFGTRRAQVYPFSQIGDVRGVFVLR